MRKEPDVVTCNSSGGVATVLSYSSSGPNVIDIALVQSKMEKALED